MGGTGCDSGGGGVAGAPQAVMSAAMSAAGGQCAEGGDVVEVDRAGFPATGVAGQVVAAADRAEWLAVVLNMPEGYLGVIGVLGEGPAWSDLAAEGDGLRHRTMAWQERTPARRFGGRRDV